MFIEKYIHQHAYKNGGVPKKEDLSALILRLYDYKKVKVYIHLFITTEGMEELELSARP